MTALTSTIVSQPVVLPGGLRLAHGTVTIDANAYATGGFQTGVSQWTGGDPSLPNRFPDYVLWSGGQEGQALTSLENVVYKNNGRVIIDDGLVTDDVGTAEEDNAEAQTAATWNYLAFWVNADGPAPVSTALLSTN